MWIGRRKVGMRDRLEEIENLGHILFIPIFGTGDIASPFARVPDFHPMVQADEDNLLVIVQRHEFSGTFRESECGPPCRFLRCPPPIR